MQRLKQDLFESSKIDPHSRPVRNEEEVVHVEVNFDVTHILSLVNV